MSETNCKRCGNTGKVGRFSHVQNGRCFACGRAAEVAPVSADLDAVDSRETAIAKIAALLAQATSNPEHFAPVVFCGETEAAPSFNRAQNVVRSAPADVKSRALAAFARLGIQL